MLWWRYNLVLIQAYTVGLLYSMTFGEIGERSTENFCKVLFLLCVCSPYIGNKLCQVRLSRIELLSSFFCSKVNPFPTYWQDGFKGSEMHCLDQCSTNFPYDGSYHSFRRTLSLKSPIAKLRCIQLPVTVAMPC